MLAKSVVFVANLSHTDQPQGISAAALSAYSVLYSKEITGFVGTSCFTDLPDIPHTPYAPAC